MAQGCEFSYESYIPDLNIVLIVNEHFTEQPIQS